MADILLVRHRTQTGGMSALPSLHSELFPPSVVHFKFLIPALGRFPLWVFCAFCG